MRRTMLAAIGAILLLPISPFQSKHSVAATVIDMEGTVPPGGFTSESNSTRQFGDFRLFIFEGHYVDKSYSQVQIGNYPNNGSSWLLHDDIRFLTITHVDLKPFSFYRFDVSEYFINFSRGHRITIEGVLAAGGRVTTSFQTDSIFGFQTLALPEPWTGLESLSIRETAALMAYDNIVVSAVPLPAALPLFGVGIGLLGLHGWRRRRNAAATT